MYTAMYNVNNLHYISSIFVLFLLWCVLVSRTLSPSLSEEGIDSPSDEHDDSSPQSELQGDSGNSTTARS